MLGSVKDVVDALGGSSGAAEVAQVGVSAVSNWKDRGVIPPEYFVLFADELARRGKQVDRAVFGFKPAAEASA